MSELQELLERFAEDGEPRGASSVFTDALNAAGDRRRRRRNRVVVATTIVVALVVGSIAAIASNLHHDNLDVKTINSGAPADLSCRVSLGELTSTVTIKMANNASVSAGVGAYTVRFLILSIPRNGGLGRIRADLGPTIGKSTTHAIGGFRTSGDPVSGQVQTPDGYLSYSCGGDVNLRPFPSAAEQALRNHPKKAGPFPDMTGVIEPKSIEHHSGGPYLTARQAADIVLKNYDCRLGGHAGKDPNSSCEQVDVRFFDHYASFWAVEGGQTQFVGAWGPDREMYVVTIFGTLPFVTTALNQKGPAYAPDRTYQIDATTGQVTMTGGYPLPEGFPGIRTFRSD